MTSGPNNDLPVHVQHRILLQSTLCIIIDDYLDSILTIAVLYHKGGELMKHIYNKGRLDEAETRKYMRQIISSVDHLHRAGIIHR